MFWRSHMNLFNIFETVLSLLKFKLKIIYIQNNILVTNVFHVPLLKGTACQNFTSFVISFAGIIWTRGMWTLLKLYPLIRSDICKKLRLRPCGPKPVRLYGRPHGQTLYSIFWLDLKFYSIIASVRHMVNFERLTYSPLQRSKHLLQRRNLWGTFIYQKKNDDTVIKI